MKPWLASILVITACATADDPYDGDQQDLGSTTYVDVLDYSKIDQSRWYATIHHLNDKFTELCGNGGCGSSYPRLTPLTFGCSVSSKLGSVRHCGWTFAAANLVVDTRDARVLADVPRFHCELQANIYINKLLPILEGDDPLHAGLPNAESIMTQLSVCFQNPIADAPGTVTPNGAQSYVAASDYYTTAVRRQQWAATKAALVDGFDRVCGDTFCGSDFGDLQALDFECSITKSTGNVRNCTWAFAGSFHTVIAKSGVLATTTKAWKCSVAVTGTLSQLITTMTAAAADEPIRRALPGTSASAYDALLACDLAR